MSVSVVDNGVIAELEPAPSWGTAGGGVVRDAALAAVRGRVLFIGGGTCAGKTTLARHLSLAYGIPLFSADDHLDRYARLAERAGSPVANHVTETDFERFWMRDPVLQFREMRQFYCDIFPFVLADLAEIVAGIRSRRVLAPGGAAGRMARYESEWSAGWDGAGGWERVWDCGRDAFACSVDEPAVRPAIVAAPSSVRYAVAIDAVGHVAGSFAARPAVVAEGIAFLPGLLAAAGIPACNCMFLTADADVHAERYAHRDWVDLMLAGCADRSRAFGLWMARDELFAAHVRDACARAGYRHVPVGR